MRLELDQIVLFPLRGRLMSKLARGRPEHRRRKSGIFGPEVGTIAKCRIYSRSSYRRLGQPSK
jgi:hypothetical protein